LNDEGGDDPRPVHLPPSIQCAEYCVIPGNSNPVGLFRINDGDEEREKPLVPWILAVVNRVSVLWAWQVLEALLHIFVLPTRQSATTFAEMVNLPPTLLCLPDWLPSDRVVEFVRHSVQQLPDDPVVLETPRFLEETRTTHHLEVLQ
jgi:hypothetical protein